jgi:hypothetical protein
MLERNPRVKIMVMGYPKAGKTGALASLVNSGRYKLRILDFDHNPDPLYAFVNKERYGDVSIKTLTDNLRDDSKRIRVSGDPVAFRDALRSLDHWVDDEGRDYGAVKDWGEDVVLVLDSLTSMGEAAFRRRRHVRPSGSSGEDTDGDWGAAMRDQAAMLEMLANPKFKCHVVVLTHIKMVEPKILRETGKDSDAIKKAKAAISLERAEKVAIRQCPSALGNALPPEIARFLPAVVLVRSGPTGRKIITKGEEGIDTGVPARHIKREYPVDTGMLSIFDAILENGEENGSEE